LIVNLSAVLNFDMVVWGKGNIRRYHNQDLSVED
jgi:hypothetical protein